MASVGWALLLFLTQLLTLDTYGVHANGNITHHSTPIQCRPDQAKALLKLKQSLSFDDSTTTLPSWQVGTDCCLWEGVGCSNSSGHVTALDLSGRGLFSHGLDPVIFNLTSLRTLDLSMNDFDGYSMSDVGFEKLTLLTHLNLSNSGFWGEVPVGIGQLVNLISLDLSNHYDDDDNSFVDTSNSLSVSNFHTIVRNLSNLRELYLDGLYIHSSGEEWCNALAKSVPHLHVLSLEGCSLYGPIHQSLSSLSSLTVINLQYNDGIFAGPFPEFFMDFVNLSVLQLANTTLEGRFPRRIFQSKNLRVLDLSGNMNLSGNLPNFSNASSLETLRLDRTDLSYAKPSSSSNFKSLIELGLDVKFISSHFLSSFDMFGSISQLRLTGLGFLRELGSILSWIRDLKNLTSLELFECDFSSTMPTSIVNLKSLRSLTIVDCNLTRPILSAIGNLMDLENLKFKDCRLHNSMPSAIGNLKNLRRLHIDNCRFFGPMPSSIGNLVNLISLTIDNSDFSGPIPSAIGNLVNLISLTIDNSDFSGPIPSTVGFLRNLEILKIIYCQFDGPMPSAIGNLTNLKSLEISGSQISGPIPYTFGFLRNLEILYIYCQFDGPMPSTIGNLTNLKSLEISGSRLAGPIPSTIGFLRNLEILNIIDCQFDGPMPSTIGNLTNLKSLEIFDSQLYGPIPSTVGQLKELTSLGLRGCNFSGRIPSSIANLNKLIELDLSGNYLSGEIPESFFTMPVLQDIDLSQNGLTGQIPRSFFQLISLRSLDIGRNNLVGLVDLTSFWRLTKLERLVLSHNKLSVMDERFNSSSTYPSGPNDLYYLDLSSNKLSGDVPNWIWGRWNSEGAYLNLSHNMFTGMQLTSAVLPTNIAFGVLDLSSNRLQGQLPMPNSSGGVLDYSNNNFSSVLPNFTLYLRDTWFLGMSKNNINGHIPRPICNSTPEVLDLSYNNFSGPIPPCLIENVRMRVLNLRENHFEGALPSNITSGCTFQTIDLHGNKIEGQLPRALSYCSHLEVLDIGNNLIVDTFPSWLRGLSNLYVLILRSNRFYGSIGDTVGHHQSREYFSSLQIIDLASNNFSGNLSSEWFGRLKSMMAKFNSTGQFLDRNLSGWEIYQDSTEISYKGHFETFERILTTLTAIDFSNNRLEGTIPESIGRLVSLRVLNMSHNAFTGQIPAQLGGMTDLESLDLSGNRLSGEIPQELTNLTFLSILNLSDNQLVGKIPQSRQFSTFDNSSFGGNAGLCGLPLSNSCGVSPSTPGEAHVDKHADVVLFLFIGLGFGVGFAAAILTRWGRLGKWLVKSARASWT